MPSFKKHISIEELCLNLFHAYKREYRFQLEFIKNVGYILSRLGFLLDGKSNSKAYKEYLIFEFYGYLLDKDKSYPHYLIDKHIQNALYIIDPLKHKSDYLDS